MSTSRPIRVLIVDATWWSREAVLRVLERNPRFEAEAADSRRAAQPLVQDFQPDVVIVDIDDADGPELLEELRQRDVPAIAWGSGLSDANLVTALSAGASYVTKAELDPDRLCQLIAIVASGDALLPQATRRILSDVLRRGRDAPARKYDLTPREVEVLAHIAEGRTNAEIAQALHLAPSSVKKLVSRLLQRLGVRNRTEAALLAHLEGLGREDAQSAAAGTSMAAAGGRPAA